MEKTLTHHGGKFAGGSKVTIADFILASYIGNCLENPNNPAKVPMEAAMDDTPKFKTYVMTAKDTFTHLKTREPI